MNNLLFVTLFVSNICFIGTLILVIQMYGKLRSMEKGLHEAGRRHFVQLSNVIGGYKSNTVNHIIYSQSEIQGVIERESRKTRQRIGQIKVQQYQRHGGR